MDHLTFVRSHRANERPRHRRHSTVTPVTTLLALGAILLVAAGVMINANLGVV